MKIFKKVVDAVKETVKALDEVMPDLPAPKPEPKPKPKDAPFVRWLGERIGFTGIAIATVAAALFGAVGCNEPTSTSPSVPTASCDEPATWCTAVTR